MEMDMAQVMILLIRTALASVIVGSTFGVATRANITAIKAFGDDGSANLSDIIQGINWVITTAASTGRPSIISITVTISGYQPFDNAVTNALNAGIHVVVAAGDQNVDASTISPARVTAAVTVGAVAANGSKLSTSNFGSVVDVWGPGRNVPVAWISSPNAALTLVGTTASAASNVAGILAVAIDNHGNKSPAALQADLKSNAQTVNGFLIPKVW
ncbi:peptidase S8/S53 subtilisin kexin sedolisin [Rhizoctonia solani AG-1 IB]|nr:peptidase S8/S53 subtilisin kexin sedolisin [Rhizoctonia solani AG-1 IB]